MHRASPTRRDRVAALVDHYLFEALLWLPSTTINKLCRVLSSGKIGGAPEAEKLLLCTVLNDPSIHLHIDASGFLWLGVDAFLFQTCCSQAVI